MPNIFLLDLKFFLVLSLKKIIYEWNKFADFDLCLPEETW
jgi:hypothetical protein